MKDRKPIATKASQPKRGTKFIVDGKELYLYRVKSADNYLLCDDQSFGLEANYTEFNPDSLNPAQKERSPINRVSDKQIIINRLYGVLRGQFLINHKYCAAKLEGCSHIATTVHHPGGRIGEKMLDDSKFVALCGNCHSYLEIHPTEAKELGFSESRLQTTKL